ncbi:MAG: hypothetical protein ACTSUE_02520 [Promethearchaeota archaeon]
MNYVFNAFWLGVGAGIGAAYAHFGFNGTGNPPVIQFDIPKYIHKGRIIIEYNDKVAFHIHHWMVYFILFFIMLLLKFYAGLGFCFVMLVHGLTQFEDSFVVQVSNPWTQQHNQEFEENNLVFV